MNFAFLWSDRTLVLLGTGAVDSLKSSWWLLKKNRADTIIFSLVVGLLGFGMAIGQLIVTLIAATPGLIIIFSGVGAKSVVMVGIGVVLIVLIALPVSLVCSGYIGSIKQSAYAMACRDLCLKWGIPFGIDVPVPVITPPILINNLPPPSLPVS
jgi:hypothetical protein